MGSAQSARRIQPGGGSGRVGGPADLSRPPFLPTPPPALPPPPPLLLLPGGGGLRRVRGWAGGAGGGVGGGPSPDRRPAAAGRISTAAVRRDRLRDGWEGPAGKVARGAPSRPVFPPPASSPGRARVGVAAAVAAGPPPECYSPPAAALAESRGRGSETRRRALPPPGAHPRGGPPRGGAPRGGAPAFLVGGRATPPTARPLSHPLPAPPATGARAGGGGADCPQCAPGGSRRRARGGSLGATRASLEEGDGGASARGRRRCRLPTRPVLKHGPRSLTRARVRGSHESRRGAMKVKAGALAGRGGIPRPLQSAEGAPPARLARRAGEVEHERTC